MNFSARLYKVDLESSLGILPRLQACIYEHGIPTDDEIKEHLASDAQALKLSKPLSPSKIFDFSLQKRSRCAS